MNDPHAPLQLDATTRRPRRSRAIVAAVAGLAVLVVGLGVAVAVLLTRQTGNQADTSSSPSASPTAKWKTGCAEVGEDVDAGGQLEVDRMQVFGRWAYEAPNSDVSAAGDLLARAAQAASEAIGQPNEQKYATGLRAAAIVLRKACVAAGYLPG